MYKTYNLEVEKESTIFHVKSDDYIDTCLIRSKEYILFTLQKQKMEFYTVNNFKRSDLWDYFFEHDLTRCFKNREGSKIAVVDKSGALTLFNFLKHLDQSREAMVPANRRNDPVACIEITTTLPENKILTCSTDRDLRIFLREKGTYFKKYDLSCFTDENITTMRLGKD